jgi:hypothetical protein
MVSRPGTRHHRRVPRLTAERPVVAGLVTGQENIMTSKISNLTCRTRRAAILTLTMALLGGFSSRAAAQSEQSGSKEGPVGPWAIQVTLRDCATGAPLGPAFNSLVTFHRGGTLSESAGGTTFAPGQRSPGHGTWTRVGHDTYLQRFVAMILFTTAPNLPGVPGFNPALPVSPGFQAGSSTVTHTFVLTDSDHATSSGTNEFFAADGTRYRSGCSTAVARRFE